MDNERLFRRLLDQSCDLAIVFLAVDGRIIGWSGGAEYVFGYSLPEIEGKLSSILFVPEDREAGLDRHEIEVAVRSGSAEDDRWMQRKDGSRFWANGTLTAITDGDGARVIGLVKVLRNRTDLKEQADRWRLQVYGLEESVRRKDIFLSTLSHELRGPLAPISMAVGVIRSNGSNNESIEHMLKVIERQRLVLQRLVDDLLDMTRIGHGKIELEREKLSMREILEAVVEDTQEMARSKGHTVQLILPIGELMVDGDRKRLHQVFSNLVTNAVKYTPPGGRIRLNATAEGNEVVTRVEDSGIGIGSDMLPRIFDLFTQVDSAREHSAGGLGIGLALVRDLVSMHDGSVQVRSEGLGKGSEFVVRLPLAGPALRANDQV